MMDSSSMHSTPNHKQTVLQEQQRLQQQLLFLVWHGFQQVCKHSTVGINCNAAVAWDISGWYGRGSNGVRRWMKGGTA